MKELHKQVWREARKEYLDQIGITESEIQTDHRRQQYFFIDGVKVWMPDELETPRKFLAHLKTKG